MATPPLTITGAGPTGSPTGALNSVSGANTVANSITLSGSASIGSSSAAAGDGLTLSGPIGIGSNTLTFIVAAGNTSVKSAISGTGGSVAYSGTGTLQLSGSNSFSNGLTVNSGTVITGSTGLGSGTATMNGGTLGFTSGGIGMHVATNGGAGVFNTITAGFSAGFIPISNWNNLLINHGTAPISSGAAGDSPLPFVLNDSNGLVTTANVSAWVGGNGFGNTPNGTTGDQQLFSSGLNAQIANNNPSTFTISNIPYPTYSVYVYYWNNTAGAIGSEQIASGATPTSLTTNPLEYWYNTGGPNPSTYVIGGTTVSNEVVNADYGVWSNVSGATLKVMNTEISGGTPWIAGIEIVSNNPTLPNLVSLTASSTIDVTGPTAVTMGALTVSGNSTLNVTGGSDIGTDNYSLSFPSVTLNSNATFHVANNKNGSGLGFLNLGAINDGGSNRSVTVSGPGTVTLTSATGNIYGGGTNVTAGTLQLVDMTTNSADSATGSGTVAVSGTGVLAGPTNSGGNAYLGGLLNVTSGGTVRSQSSAVFSLQKGLTLANGSTANIVFNKAASYAQWNRRTGHFHHERRVAHEHYVWGHIRRQHLAVDDRDALLWRYRRWQRNEHLRRF